MPKAQKVQSYCIPLIFYTGRKNSFSCSLGIDNVGKNLSDSFQAHLLNEINKVGGADLSDKINSRNLSIEVRIDSLHSQLPFVREGQVIFVLVAYTQRHHEEWMSANFSLKTTYTLKKEAMCFFQNHLSIRLRHLLT